MTPYSEKEREEAAAEVMDRVQLVGEYTPLAGDLHSLAITLCMQKARLRQALTSILINMRFEDRPDLERMGNEALADTGGDRDGK